MVMPMLIVVNVSVVVLQVCSTCSVVGVCDVCSGIGMLLVTDGTSRHERVG
jgi:hypothetical protein